MVAANVILISDRRYGIESLFGDAQIVNYGAVAGVVGVFSVGSSGSSSSTIENEAGGLITGYGDGIYTLEPGDIVLNDGSITSSICGIYDADGRLNVC